MSKLSTGNADILMAARERLRARVVIDDAGCWLWQGAIASSNGYGRIHVGERVMFTHRLSYEVHRGPIPDGLHIDHLCRVRACCNPEHLEPVTCRENVHRSPISNAGKTHCLRNHPFDAENSYVSSGRRRCRKCQRDAQTRRALRAAGVEAAA